MKASVYNYSTIMGEGESLLFNFYTLNLIVLDRNESKLADELLENPNTHSQNGKIRDMLDLLIAKGYIVGSKVNEFELLKRNHYFGYTQKQNLSLTILPSLACNFRCKYCYQKEVKEKMLPNIQEALIDYVRNKIYPGGSLTVTWFGGEPLLFVELIEKLSNAFINICQENNVKYSASIITNGYFLNTANTEMLIRNQVNHVQITLDGPPKIHDIRRPLKNGGGTFWSIFKNIKKASKKINTSIRMNVDQDNRENISELLEIFVQNNMEKRIAFYLGKTSPYTEVCSDVLGYCLSDEDFTLLGLETQIEMIKQGFSFSFGIPECKDSSCMVDNGNSFCIAPSGGVFNCWNEVANPKKEIGHLIESQNSKMKENIYQWLKRDPFNRKDCPDCKLLPICMGGCSYKYALTGRPSCPGWKHHLDESLIFYYYYKKLQHENKIAWKFRKAVELVKELKTFSDINYQSKQSSN